MWKPGTYHIAISSDCLDTRAGYIYRGLGLHKMWEASPKGRRPASWKVTHLGSGHGIAIIKGTVSEAFPIATEIAECSEWDFDGLDGWRNRDPDLPTKVKAIIDRHGKRARIAAGGGGSNEAARLVLTGRLSS